MNCQLGLCLAVANLPRTRGARGMVKGFLTARFADAIGGRDPKIGRAGVKHHGEPLRRRAHAHNSIILRLGGGTKWSAPLCPPGCCCWGAGGPWHTVQHLLELCSASSAKREYTPPLPGGKSFLALAFTFQVKNELYSTDWIWCSEQSSSRG